jgi:predicted permease
MQNIAFYFKFKQRMKIDDSGQILLEVLIAMAVSAVVVILGSQLIYASLSGNKNSEDGDVATGLAYEEYSAVGAAATENWSNISSLIFRKMVAGCRSRKHNNKSCRL